MTIPQDSCSVITPMDSSKYALKLVSILTICFQSCCLLLGVFTFNFLMTLDLRFLMLSSLVLYCFSPNFLFLSVVSFRFHSIFYCTCIQSNFHVLMSSKGFSEKIFTKIRNGTVVWTSCIPHSGSTLCVGSAFCNLSIVIRI